MGDNSSIEWTDATWNPTAGCTPVSEGCRNCYAAKEALRLASNPNPKIAAKYEGTAEMRGTDEKRRAVFTGRVNMLEDVTLPLTWGKPRRIFVNSMSDLFHPDIPFSFVDKVFAVMSLANQHTFQILTKRPERMQEYLSHEKRIEFIELARREFPHPFDVCAFDMRLPLPNVWLGTSVEDQDAADVRIPYLINTPAAVRFLSCEPLLGPVDLRAWLNSAHLRTDFTTGEDYRYPAKLHWVIVGGESGAGARPMHPAWARSLRHRCTMAGIPFFFKQWGSWKPIGWCHHDSLAEPKTVLVTLGGKVLEQHPRLAGFDAPLENSMMEMRRVGKHEAGRALDGRTWSEFPEVAR